MNDCVLQLVVRCSMRPKQFLIVRVSMNIDVILIYTCTANFSTCTQGMGVLLIGFEFRFSFSKICYYLFETLNISV